MRKIDIMMSSITTMFGKTQEESLQREEQFRGEVHQLVTGNQKDIAAYAAQVSHLTDTVTSLQSQLSNSSDYAVDAVQQVRDELSSRIDALSNNQASNAGGAGGALAGRSLSGGRFEPNSNKRLRNPGASADKGLTFTFALCGSPSTSKVSPKIPSPSLPVRMGPRIGTPLNSVFSV